ncbi:cytochrome P450 [Rhizobium rhizogenes]|uniref:cytochrome P450 n=1 Tax=Rhizobium rhizogenes TaxID=359 RepID=UPI0024BE65CD|nr:cytochrome P450 [Rhizobium rhizogenes]MDJ1638190.1 cytochrome P450 [Rhizobium rhizogenes]
MSIAALLTSIRWLLLDQRRLIAEGFGSSDRFALKMYLPVYSDEGGKRAIPIKEKTVHFVRAAADIAAVHKSSADAVSTGAAYAFLKPYFGDQSVFVMEGDDHIAAKQAVYRAIRSNMEFAEDDLLFFKLSVKETVPAGAYPVLPALQRISCAFVLRTIFGEQGTDVSERTIDHAVGAACNASGTFLLLPNILRWTRKFGKSLAIRRQRLALREFISTQLAGLNIGDDWSAVTPAFSHRQRTEIIDNLMTLLIAGFETTSTTLAWLLYELAANPDIQADLRAELIGRSDGEDLAFFEDDTTLLARCVQEALRLHPSIPFIIREIKSPDILPDLPAKPGDYLVLSIEEAHKVASGTSFGRFDPGRFLDKGTSPRLATFGGGAKICPGRAIAVQQLRILCAILVGSYLITITPRTDPRIERNRVSATPRGGMELSLQRLV